jgi:hypothetical protein
MKNNTQKYLFVKWFIIFAAILAVTAIAGHLGFFAFVLANDISHLSSIISVLFLICSFATGKLSYDVSKGDIDPIKLRKWLMVLNFMADAFFTLGLLGTIIGFCYMMHGVLNAAVDITTIIAQLKIGASTKLYATLFGIVSSLLLQVQLLLIKTDLIGTKLEDTEEEK